LNYGKLFVSDLAIRSVVALVLSLNPFVLLICPFITLLSFVCAMIFAAVNVDSHWSFRRQTLCSLALFASAFAALWIAMIDASQQTACSGNVCFWRAGRILNYGWLLIGTITAVQVLISGLALASSRSAAASQTR
jgi:hypothetical protein